MMEEKKMKTSHIIIVLGIIISSSVIFAMLFESPFEKERYDIKISGLKEAYLVGEPYSFSYTIFGYGYACANREVTYPDENGNTVRNGVDVDCNAGAPKINFVIDSKDKSNMTPIGIKNPGTYYISAMFWQSTGIEPTQAFDGFHVVEKICDDSDPKDRSQCFAESYESCESVYMTQQFTTKNGGTVYLEAVVESWYDCTLRVYTENSLGEHTPFNGIRSICKDVTINENSLNFENCNNADYPPITFILQDSKSESETLGLTSILKLTISNQSFDIDPVDILVKIDGKTVIDDEFLVKQQHNYQDFEFSLKPGTHTLYAESTQGKYQLKEEFTIENELWASLDFQYSEGDETLPKLRLIISETELGFL